MSSSSSLRCRTCGEPVTFDEPIPRDAECPGCGHDLRCCVNCRHYDTRYNNSCRETMADPVEDKHRRNFCEYFQFNRESSASRPATSGREADARAKLEKLFGEQTGAKPGSGSGTQGPGGTSERSSEARKKLDQLFGGKPKRPESDEE